MKKGDHVRVHPHGDPARSADAAVVLIPSNGLTIAVEFFDVPPFCKLIVEGGGQIGINQVTHRVTMLATRSEIDGKPWGPWVEVTGGGHFEIEAIPARSNAQTGCA